MQVSVFSFSFERFKEKSNIILYYSSDQIGFQTHQFLSNNQTNRQKKKKRPNHSPIVAVDWKCFAEVSWSVLSPFKVHPSLFEPRSPQFYGGRRQSSLHEVDGRSRAKRLINGPKLMLTWTEAKQGQTCAVLSFRNLSRDFYILLLLSLHSKHLMLSH